MKRLGLLGISRLRIGRFGTSRSGIGRSGIGRSGIGRFRVGRFGIGGRQSEQRVRQGIGGTLAVVLALILTLIPLLWMLLASVKSRSDLYAKPLRILPSKLIWHNYGRAWNEVPFASFFVNSAVTTLATTVIKVLLGATTAYALVFLRFPLRRLLFWFVVASLMVPFEVVLIPNYVATAQLRWLDTWAGIVIPTAGVAFGAFLLHQSFRSIPTEIIEAAELDGVSRIGLLTRIVAPMSMPAISAFALITAVSKWNDYLWPRLVSSKGSSATLPVGLTLLRNSEGLNEYGPIMAGAVLVIAPMIPILIVAQRRIVDGLTGGVKG
jgi:sn-glycerol 3-phosphate transport system permease protein